MPESRAGKRWQGHRVRFRNSRTEPQGHLVDPLPSPSGEAETQGARDKRPLVTALHFLSPVTWSSTLKSSRSVSCYSGQEITSRKGSCTGISAPSLYFQGTIIVPTQESASV